MRGGRGRGRRREGEGGEREGGEGVEGKIQLVNGRLMHLTFHYLFQSLALPPEKEKMRA